MKLTTKLAHVCLDFLKRNTEIEKQVIEFFSGKEGKYGYHASQLMHTHGLPAGLAYKMSAYLNMWLAWIPALPVPEKIRDRLTRCTKSLSSLAGRPSTCQLKLCPWCRSLKILQVTALLAKYGAQGCTLISVPMKDRGSLSKPPVNAILTVKNVVSSAEGPLLSLAYFYPELKPGFHKADVSIVSNILNYDFKFLHPDWIGFYLDATNNMNFFSRKIKT